MAGLAVVLVMVGVVSWCLHREKDGFIGAASTELRGAMNVWEKEGRPAGAGLDEFMRKVPRAIVISNKVFLVNGKEFKTQFATEKLGFPATLFITTNGDLLLLDSGRLTAVPIK